MICIKSGRPISDGYYDFIVEHSDLLVSTVEYPLIQINSRHFGENGENGENNGEEKAIIDAIRENAYITQPKLAAITGFSQRKVNRLIAVLIESGKIKRVGKTKGGHWEIID